MSPKYKSVSLRFDTYDKVGSLSKTITPGVNLSFAKTIDYAVENLIGDRLGSTDGKTMYTANDYTQKEASK